MKFETALVYLEQLPDVVVKTDTDWAAILGFVITIAAFYFGTKAQIRNFKKTVVSQEKVASRSFEIQNRMIESQQLIARQGSLKESRQNWINDLRDACSQFVAAADNVQRLNVLKGSPGGAWSILKEKNPVEYVSAENEWSANHVGAKREVRRLAAKIELLINPSESDSKLLMEKVRCVESECDKTIKIDESTGARIERSSKDLEAPCNDLVKICQKILKTEWEKAKAGR
ncbi:hypothetical protein G7011_00445 [Pseudomonas plecoglossicida]|uniref:hypothetical protein n=1 Tax=Pseudomonas plecoglossicida TaxID=70775 RepID=UPI0015E33869|nr:hypothetical protein [Pseudomonas plecoglossicida]MBA1195582.1 hypothetical protein [Pseudomonas plecoglossicida]